MNPGVAGAVAGLLAVALGAFAAHGLKSRLSPDMLAVFETGVRYQMYHALALIAAAWAVRRVSPPPPTARRAAWCFLFGIVFFSGSLYLLALTGVRALGAITPVGGVLFLLGWIFLALALREN